MPPPSECPRKTARSTPSCADDVQHEIRELREARVGLAQRRREAEARQLDDVRRVPEGAQCACLWSERDGGRAHPWKQDGVRPACRTAALDADPVARVLDDRLTHLITMYPRSAAKGPDGLGRRSSPQWGIRYSRASAARFQQPREKGSTWALIGPSTSGSTAPSRPRSFAPRRKIVPEGQEPPIWGFDGSSTQQAPGDRTRTASSSRCSSAPTRSAAATTSS